MRDSVALHPGVQLDYAQVLSADNLRKIDRVDKSSPDSAVALIAARVGTTRETVARTLGQLSRSGVVRRHGRELMIVKPDLLESLGELDG